MFALCLLMAIMITTAPALPLMATQAGFRRFSVAEYHRMIQAGILTEDDRIELIDGYILHKMSRNPPHDSALYLLYNWLSRQLPDIWIARGQSAITLARSEPEPDIAIVRGPANNYFTRHPEAADVGLVVEISEATLAGDRGDKARIYAEAGIPIYWIVNLIDRQIEVYTSPVGQAYTHRQDYSHGGTVPVMLDGVVIGNLQVADVIT